MALDSSHYNEQDIIAGKYPSDHFTMRLQRFLARAGVASRRGSEKLISAGRVCVNGKQVRVLGTKVMPQYDHVTVDGKEYVLGNDHVYLLLNKPPRVLTTMSDPFGFPCVASLVPCDDYPGLFPVGRLDSDTTGVLLFTTNGNMGNRLLHPSHHVWKTYVALIEGKLTSSQMQKLSQGIMLEDGMTSPCFIRTITQDEPCTHLDKNHSLFDDMRLNGASSLCELKIHEGRNHQVKRMLQEIGHPVIKLHRFQFGPLCLNAQVPLGSWRMCTQQEIHDLETVCEDNT